MDSKGGAGNVKLVAQCRLFGILAITREEGDVRAIPREVTNIEPERVKVKGEGK